LRGVTHQSWMRAAPNVMAQRGEEAQGALKNGLKMAPARLCCRDGQVNQSSLRHNITTRHPGAASSRPEGSQHSDRKSPAANAQRCNSDVSKNQVRYDRKK
jgi:hypothetical protein